IIPAAARTEASSGKLIRYRVRRTDTIATIADEFDVTAAELRKWNHLKADHVVRGTSLRIYPGGMTPGPAQQQEASNKAKTAVATPVAARQSTSTRKSPVMEARTSSSVVHRVKQGETL